MLPARHQEAVGDARRDVNDIAGPEGMAFAAVEPRADQFARSRRAASTAGPEQSRNGAGQRLHRAPCRSASAQ